MSLNRQSNFSSSDVLNPSSRYRRIPTNLLVIMVLAIAMAFSSVSFTRAASPPLPSSPVITGIEWSSTIAQGAVGSDTWPITWADDNHQYTTFGDGFGFDPLISDKLSIGFSRIEGEPNNFSSFNIRSSSGEQTGNGAEGKKASGMLSVDGTLYMWVRNADNNGRQCQLASSNDHANTWTWSNWKFSELGYCAFLNFGKDYAGARDGFVYMFTPDTSSAYNETDDVVLTRVPKGSILDRGEYEFFVSRNGSNASWSSDIGNRNAVATMPGMANRLDVTYNPGIDRYLMTMRSRDKVGGVNQFSIYDAPEPWGPWTTVFYTESWEGGSLSKSNGGWGESAHIPSKWISDNGKEFYLVFAGDDSFKVRKATLTVEAASSGVWPTNGWRSASAAEMGMDQTLLEQARNYGQSSGAAGMITRGGNKVMSWGNTDQLFELKSSTKSIGGSTALGLAIGDGLVSLDDKAQSHLSSIGNPPSSNANTGWLDDITIRHLATQTAGFEKTSGFGKLTFEPGTAWGYTDGGPNWLADLLTVKFGDDLKKVLFDRVFSNLGITSSDWNWRDNFSHNNTVNGIKSREFGSGISANADAMARIGYLYLRSGLWEDQQLLPQSFVNAAGKPVDGVIGLPVRNDDQNRFDDASDHFGLLWWNNGDGAMPGVPLDTFWSWGLGNSHIVVIPSLDIVAVRAAGADDGWSGSRNPSYYQVLEPFLDPIARSVTGEPPTPDAPANLQASGVSQTSISLTWNSVSFASIYRIYRDGTLIKSVSSPGFTDSTGLQPSVQYSYEVSAVNGLGVEGSRSNPSTASVIADESLPFITSVVSSGSPNTIIVEFSEQLDAGTASDASNYSIDNGVGVLSASLNSDDESVTLNTTDHTAGSSYTLTVSDVQDTSGNAIVSNSKRGYLFQLNLDISNLLVTGGVGDYTVVTDGLHQFGMVYTDRPYTFTIVPLNLVDKTYIQTANSDKTRTDGQLTFDVNQDVTLFLGYDERASNLPNWMAGWTFSGARLGTSDQEADLNIYEKDFGKGLINLGGNNASGAADTFTNYTVVIVGKGTASTTPNQAPTVALSASSVTGTIPIDIEFDASGSFDPDGVIEYHWDFDDGTELTVSDPIITHEFLSAGTYQVLLTITDDDGATDNTSIEVIVDAPPPDALSLSIQYSFVLLNQSTSFSMSIGNLPNGLADFSIDVGVDEFSSAEFEIVDVTFPEIGQSSFDVLPSGDVRLFFDDTDNVIQPDDTNALVVTFVVRGISSGFASFGISNVGYMNGDVVGASYLPDVDEGIFQVFDLNDLVMPGMDGPVQDLNLDGLAEDINGNGRFDFNDIVVLFDNIESPAIQNVAPIFDLNENTVFQRNVPLSESLEVQEPIIKSGIDFEDVILLFEQLVME